MTHIGTISPDGKRGSFTNNFSFIIDDSANKGNISFKDGSVIYRGVINVDDNDSFNAYINLIGFNPDFFRKIKVCEIEILPDELFKIEEDTVKIEINKEHIGSSVQIVEIPPFGESIYDTNLVIIDQIADKSPCWITLPEGLRGKDFVIWINTMCKKINRQ